MSNLSGLNIVVSLAAVESHSEWKVVSHPIHKRRRNWRPLRVTTQRPCAYVIYGNTLICHPSLYSQMQSQIDAANRKAAEAMANRYWSKRKVIEE